MLRKIFLYGILGYYLIFVQSSVFAYNYEVECEDDEIFTKCDEFPDNYMDKLIDLSEMQFDSLDNGSIRLHGSFKLKEILEPFPIPMSVQLYKHQRGQWVSTIYNINRNDMCKALYTPGEYWYPFTNKLAPNMRTCPFPEDFSADIDTIAALMLHNIPDKNMEGEYKCTITFKYGAEADQFVCFNIRIYVHKL